MIHLDVGTRIVIGVVCVLLYLASVFISYKVGEKYMLGKLFNRENNDDD